MLKSVSYILFRTESLVCKLSVSLLDGSERNAAYSIYETQLYDYLTFNPTAYIVLQYRPPVQSQYDPRTVVHINDRNIVNIRRVFKQFYELYSKPDLFIYYKSGAIEYHDDQKNIVNAILSGNEFIELEPGVITDPKTKETMAGVKLRINMREYECQLSSDEFEALLNILLEINIKELAMQCVIGSMLVTKQTTNSGDFTKKQRPVPVNIFQRKQESSEDSVKSNLVTPKEIKSLDDV